MTSCVVCPGVNPKDAETGTLACFGCSNRVLRHLRELEDYLPTLSLVKTVTGGAGRKVGFGSQSPANDTVIHHTDARSNWDDRDGYGALAVLTEWSRLIREERQLAPPTAVTVWSELSLLRTNHDWMMGQTWVDEYATELRDIHSAVRAAASDPVPHSVGRCISILTTGECRGDVYELPDASGVKCANKSCGRIYTGLELDRLRMAQEAS